MSRRKKTPSLAQLNRHIVACQQCPRLREHCAEVAKTKRAAYRDWTYWGRPVPNFLPAGGAEPGKPETARILIAGLAPAAHGANRTGRMFTGDRSGDFLYRALYEAGLANQPTARSADDGLQLHDTVITAALHCAPPANKPTREELTACAPFLEQTLDALPHLRVIVSLGKIGHEAVLRLGKRRGWVRALADYPFAHAAEHHPPPPGPALLCSYHPSQQNTFTGRLTPDMLGRVMERARQLAQAVKV
jgi:uracil-DNA glycosylase family 4